MERCGFFDAELVGDEYDRSYLAEQFAAYFASFIGNGVFGGRSDELQIVAMEDPSMQIAVLSGQGWINGYWYENTDELYLPIDVADGVLDRIDSIILRLGFAERDMWIDVRRGVSSNNPSAPELIRNADYYELQLATVRVRAGTLSIRQADITDTRLDSNVCGFVVAMINQFDTSAFSAQLNSWMEIFREESIESVESLVRMLEAIIDSGDLGSLVTEIQALKDLFIESEEHPGCRYRVVNGNVEWLNPPNEPGVEYRLTERHEGRTIFQTVIYVASLPNASRAAVATNFTFTKIVSCTGMMHSEQSALVAEGRPFPVYMDGGVAPVAMINGITTGLSGRFINIATTMDLSQYRATVVIRYIK